ncbi:hypothetical protein C8J56DRAFT_1161400 [Mycena floridula]|nr:hypothetical protein C8J56DRAFT_1161400 [Mycena floridula]
MAFVVDLGNLAESFPFHQDSLFCDQLKTLHELPYSVTDEDSLHKEEFTGCTNNNRRSIYTYVPANYLFVEALKTVRRSVPRGKKTRRFAFFDEFPLEMIYEIFEHLHPIDFMHLSRISKSLRETVMSPTVDLIWRNAFSRESIPDCPQEVLVSRWTYLIFGPGRCYKCGKGNACADFALRLRLCSGCMGRLLSQQAPLHPQGPNLLTLVPKTFRHREDDITGTREDWNGRFLTSSLRKVIRATRRWRHSDPEVFASHTKDLKEATEKWLNFTTVCEEWAYNVWDLRNSAIYDLRDKLAVKLQERLIKEGHHPSDVDATAHEIHYLVHNESFPNYSLSNRRWNMLLPDLNRLVKVNCDERLQREYLQTIDERKLKMKRALHSTQRTRHTSEWAYFPHDYIMREWKALADVIYAPVEAILEDIDYLEAVQSIQPNLDIWKKERIQELISMLPQPKDLTPSVLKLATSVFICNIHYSVHHIQGCEDVTPHLQRHSSNTCSSCGIAFSIRGAEAVGSLLQLAGLDPLTTAEAFDQEPLRFLCENCPPRGAKGRAAMTWRGCVAHFTNSKTDHENPAWQLLSPTLTEHVMKRETDPRVVQSAWTCLHCEAHAVKPVARPLAILHVKTSHSIRRPENNVDYFYINPGSMVLSSPVFVNEMACMFCALCSPGGNNRLRNLRHLEQHLFDRHQIREPDPEKHSQSIEMIQARWPETKH